MNETLQKINYFELWKYFSDDAAKIKDKLWTVASWLYALLGGVLAFLAKGLKPGETAFEEPVLAIVIALVGLVLSVYAYWMITEYGWHIRTAWDRTDFLRTKIEGLEEVWNAGYDKTDDTTDNNGGKKLPKFVNRLLILCGLFGVMFLVVLVVAVVQVLA